jgi:hypothetical protein
MASDQLHSYQATEHGFVGSGYRGDGGLGLSFFQQWGTTDSNQLRLGQYCYLSRCEQYGSGSHDG